MTAPTNAEIDVLAEELQVDAVILHDDGYEEIPDDLNAASAMLRALRDQREADATVRAALVRAQQDINWMCNSHQLLNPHSGCFDYIEDALQSAMSAQGGRNDPRLP